MSIINFDNSQLLVDAQWYPPPQGDPADIRSFAREQAYICCIDKTYAVFRFMFAQEKYQENAEGDGFIRAIGVDLLLEHNASKSALEKIEASIADILFPLIVPCPREIALLIVQYHSCSPHLAELLYPLIIQEALTQRKIHCRLGVQQNTHYSKTYLPQEQIEDLYELDGSLHAAKRHVLHSMNVDLKKIENADPQKETFKTESRQRKMICPDGSYAMQRAHKPGETYLRTTSSYIRSNYQAILPPANPIIQPIINECLEPLAARDRQIPPVVFPNNPPERSCLEILGDFFQALWETLSNCFRSIIDCCR